MTLEASSMAPQPDRASWEKELPGLMVRYQQGDPIAVEELMRRLSGTLMRFFSGSSNSKSDAEDLFQECWIRIHRARHTYRPTEPVLPWLFAIGRHTKVDGYRRRRRRESRELLVAELPEPPIRLQQEPGGESQRFDRLMECLPDSQREVIVMLKVSGMSLEEVARATSSTVGAIKQKAHRAYEKLRLVLERESL